MLFGKVRARLGGGRIMLHVTSEKRRLAELKLNALHEFGLGAGLCSPTASILIALIDSYAGFNFRNT